MALQANALPAYMSCQARAMWSRAWQARPLQGAWCCKPEHCRAWHSVAEQGRARHAV